MKITPATSISIGLLVALAPVAFWAISLDAKVERALEESTGLRQLQDRLIRIETNVEWLVKERKKAQQDE